MVRQRSLFKKIRIAMRTMLAGRTKQAGARQAKRQFHDEDKNLKWGKFE
jgi:hypothetical protein